MKLLPTAPEVGREALTVILGALVAALIVGQLPAVKAWIKDQWA